MAEKVVFFDFDGTLTYDTQNPYKILLHRVFPKGDKAFEDECGSQQNLNAPKKSILKNYENIHGVSAEQTKKKGKFYEFAKNLYCKTFLHRIFSPKVVLNVFSKLFRASNITKLDIEKIADNTKLLKNLYPGLAYLVDHGYRVCIISGGMEPIILRSLGVCKKYITDICCAKVKFDENGKIKNIISQNYDNEGKAEYIKQKLAEYKISKENAVFVGNDANDLFVGDRMGCKTLCVNPDETAFDKKSKAKWDGRI